MPRRDEVLAAMRDSLQIQDPEWDIAPGSPEWKILEAVAQQIENITFNSVLNDYHFDPDNKSGLELDTFMSLFGYNRIRARRATGAVTFSRGTVALQDYIIPLGTQVFVPSTAFNPVIYFQTTISAVLPEGETQVSVPVQAVVGGTIGNVAANTVTGLATSVGGITAVTNPQPISGGRDAESDEDLRDRWRATVFRNISGTEDMFLALAYNESAFVSRANLIGPIERYTEQVQLIAPEDLSTTSPWVASVASGTTGSSLGVTAGQGLQMPANADAPYYVALYKTGAFQEIMKVTAKSTDTFTVTRAASPVSAAAGELRLVFPSSVPDADFIYSPGGEVVGLDIGTTTQQVGRRGTDYELITSLAANRVVTGAQQPALYVYPTGATNFGVESVVTMETEYTPDSSRNDPANSVAEKVDMFVDGVDALTVTEQIPYTDDYIFGTNVTIADFQRDDGVNPPASDNVFTQLSKAPVVSVPTTITVQATSSQAATTYYKDKDYWLVTDKTIMEGSTRSVNGLEWNQPTDIDFTAEDPTFAATIQAVAGKLTGFYSYVITYEIDGVESLPSDPIHPSGANDLAGNGKNDLTVPNWDGAGSVVWRRLYRTIGRDNFTQSDDGPFYLLKVIKDNSTVAFEDNKADTKLSTALEPPKDPPVVDTPMSIEYSYNRLIERLDATVELVRLVGMDTLVHEADDIKLKFNLAIVIVPGMSVNDLKADINTNLFAWIKRKNFQSNVQIADLVDVVANSSGVDNVRLAREAEQRNEVQKITLTPTNDTPSADRDTFTITIGGYTTQAMAYNDSQSDVRETLEALPNISEGNTAVTVIQDGGGFASNDTLLTITDNPGIHTNGSLGGPLYGNASDDFYIQVNNEIMLVTAASDGGATVDWTVKRAQLGTAAVSHSDGDSINILGDIAVVRTGPGGDDDYVFTLYFIPNVYGAGDGITINNWGGRELDLVTAAVATEESQLDIVVQERVSGAGWGIQRIARNGVTILDEDADDRFTGGAATDDFYLNSDELPSVFSVDVVVKAQNTF